jgi:hypothetical protein
MSYSCVEASLQASLRKPSPACLTFFDCLQFEPTMLWELPASVSMLLAWISSWAYISCPVAEEVRCFKLKSLCILTYPLCYRYFCWWNYAAVDSSRTWNPSSLTATTFLSFAATWEQDYKAEYWFHSEGLRPSSATRINCNIAEKPSFFTSTTA